MGMILTIGFLSGFEDFLPKGWFLAWRDFMWPLGLVLGVTGLAVPCGSLSTGARGAGPFGRSIAYNNYGSATLCLWPAGSACACTKTSN